MNGDNIVWQGEAGGFWRVGNPFLRGWVRRAIDYCSLLHFSEFKKRREGDFAANVCKETKKRKVTANPRMSDLYYFPPDAGRVGRAGRICWAYGLRGGVDLPWYVPVFLHFIVFYCIFRG